MSETKHTPGPWTAALTPAGKSKVVDVNGFSVALCQHGAYSQQTHDAHLIAAAPEMLEAHEDGPDLDWYADRLVNVYGESEGADFIIALRRKAAKARAAIKKARGEK